MEQNMTGEAEIKDFLAERRRRREQQGRAVGVPGRGAASLLARHLEESLAVIKEVGLDYSTVFDLLPADGTPLHLDAIIMTLGLLPSNPAHRWAVRLACFQCKGVNLVVRVINERKVPHYARRRVMEPARVGNVG